jgi:hypothetical protein
MQQDKDTEKGMSLEKAQMYLDHLMRGSQEICFEKSLMVKLVGALHAPTRMHQFLHYLDYVTT